MESIEEFNEFYNVMDAIITSVFIGESSRRLYEETVIEIRNCSSMSQFSGIAMLLKSRETPQLPNSLSMYEMVTNGIRAGLSSIGKRYAVNTSSLGKENYEIMCKIPDTFPTQYYASTIFKVDENNQYGGAQDEQMPFIGFIERGDPTVEMILSLIQKMNGSGDPHTGYGFVASVSMYLPFIPGNVGRMDAIVRCGRCLLGGRGCLLKGPHLIPSLKFRLPYLINVHQSINPFLLKSGGMKYCPSGKTQTY